MHEVSGLTRDRQVVARLVLRAEARSGTEPTVGWDHCPVRAYCPVRAHNRLGVSIR